MWVFCVFLENDKTGLRHFFQGLGENIYSLQLALKSNAPGRAVLDLKKSFCFVYGQGQSWNNKYISGGETQFYFGFPPFFIGDGRIATVYTSPYFVNRLYWNVVVLKFRMSS